MLRMDIASRMKWTGCWAKKILWTRKTVRQRRWLEIGSQIRPLAPVWNVQSPRRAPNCLQISQNRKSNKDFFLLAKNTHDKHRKNNKCNTIQDLESKEAKKGPELSANIAKIAKVTRIFLAGLNRTFLTESSASI